MKLQILPMLALLYSAHNGNDAHPMVSLVFVIIIAVMFYVFYSRKNNGKK